MMSGTIRELAVWAAMVLVALLVIGMAIAPMVLTYLACVNGEILCVLLGVEVISLNVCIYEFVD